MYIGQRSFVGKRSNIRTVAYQAKDFSPAASWVSSLIH
jgi:hypothetical protein